MTSKHSITTLKANSPQVVQKQKCPVRKTPLQSGDKVVLCEERDEAITLAGWREVEADWGGRCPYCGEKVILPRPPVLPLPPLVIVALGMTLLLVGLIFGIMFSSIIPRKPAAPQAKTAVPPTPCSFKPSKTFYSLWQAEQSRLGCALNEVKVFTAEQPFENGFMFWREDIDRFHYVLYNKGTWQRHEGTFMEGDPETAGYSPPPGLQEPRRGFGQVWRDELGGPNSELGWATYHEQGFPYDRWVDCEHGTMLWSGQWGDSWGIFVLYDDGTWQLKR